jgi:N-acylneuraminate cytidylyltransferase
MIGGARVVAVIPGRGGSKGVPGKNRRLLGGEPLIGWTVRAAKGCERIDHVVVTSDDAGILEAAAGADQHILRPAELAQDATPMLPVVLHALDQCGGADIVVLLQPTSPLRTSAQIDGVLDVLASSGAPGVVSVVQPGKSPYWMYRRDEGGRLVPLLSVEGATRRQDLPAAYALNGAIYAVQVSSLIEEQAFVTSETLGYEMDIITSLDIDTEWDWIMVEAALAHGVGR